MKNGYGKILITNIVSRTGRHNKRVLGECVEKSHMTSNLSLIHINARSMGNKLEYIEILLKTMKNNFDILAVSETLENDLNSHLINIPGYCKVSSMRSCKGGGTALFVKPNFEFTVIDVTTVSFESVFIETMDLDHKIKTIIWHHLPPARH